MIQIFDIKKEKKNLKESNEKFVKDYFALSKQDIKEDLKNCHAYEEGLKVLDTYRNEHPGTFIEAIWIMDEDKDIDTEYKHITNNQLIVYSEGLKDKLTWVD